MCKNKISHHYSLFKRSFQTTPPNKKLNIQNQKIKISNYLLKCKCCFFSNAKIKKKKKIILPKQNERFTNRRAWLSDEPTIML